MDLSAPLARGWARANCSGPVKASLLFRLHNSEGAPTAEAGGQCNGSSGNPVRHLCRTGGRSVWDRSCLCKPFRHTGPRHLYCQGHGWGGAGQRRSDTVARRP